MGNEEKKEDITIQNMGESSTSEDLLKKIYDNSQKQLLIKKIELACVVICLIALLVVVIRIVPRAVGLLDTLQDSASRIETTMDKADKAMDDVSSMANSVERISGGIDEIVGENGTKLSETVEKMSNIDFDGLNDAIQDLQDAVGPFANFMKRFG